MSSITEYFEIIKSIYAYIIKFIDTEGNIEENYENIITIFENQKICSNIHETKLILNLISSISVNHHRTPNFFNKIEKLILYFKDKITKIYKNKEIFYLFCHNKRIILFLINEKILTVDSLIVKKLKIFYADNYFYPEIKSFEEEQQNQQTNDCNDQKTEKKSNDFFEFESTLSDTESSDEFDIQEDSLNDDDDDNDIKKCQETQDISNKNKKDNSDYITRYDFFEKYKEEKPKEPVITDDKRLIGENDSEICEIIRKDLIEEFIIYINKNEYSLNTKIERSDYETNFFLCQRYNTSLIKYAAFFGSIQIFKYLYLNGVELKPSLWKYSIHGYSEEMIRILEDNNIKPKDEKYEQCYIESIICHHNDIAKYIESNYISEKAMKEMDNDYYYFNYYNFELFSDTFNNKSLLYSITCDFYKLAELLLKESYIDINKKEEVLSKSYSYDKKLKNHYKLYCEVSPLLVSINLKKLDFLQLFVSNPNIDVNIKSIEKSFYYLYNDRKLDFDFIEEKSALYKAIQKQNIEMTKILLSCPKIDVNNKYIKKKVTGIVVNNEIDLNDPNTKIQIVADMSLLNIAICYKNYEIVQLLLSNEKIDVNSNEIKYLSKNFMLKYSPLIIAIKMQNIKFVQLLLSKDKIDINCKLIKTLNDEINTEKTALYTAAETGNIDIIKSLLSFEKIDVNFLNTLKLCSRERRLKRTVLYKAVRANNKELVQLLLENPNIDVNIKATDRTKNQELFSEKTPLYLAVKNTDTEMVKLLLSNPKIDVNEGLSKHMNYGIYRIKKSVLYEAIDRNCIEIIQLLFSNPNIDVNFKSLRVINKKNFAIKTTEKTILYKAVEKQKPDIVKLLLSHQNIDVNEKSFGSFEILWQNGEDYNRLRTPLHLAVALENVKITELLLNNEKIDVNAKDELQRTPIDLAENFQIISLFEKH